LIQVNQLPLLLTLVNQWVLVLQPYMPLDDLLGNSLAPDQLHPELGMDKQGKLMLPKKLVPM